MQCINKCNMMRFLYEYAVTLLSIEYLSVTIFANDKSAIRM